MCRSSLTGDGTRGLDPTSTPAQGCTQAPGDPWASPRAPQSGGSGSWAHRSLVCLSYTELPFRMAVSPFRVLTSPAVCPAVCPTVWCRVWHHWPSFWASRLSSYNCPSITFTDFWLSGPRPFHDTLQTLHVFVRDTANIFRRSALHYLCPAMFSELTVSAFKVLLMRPFLPSKPQRSVPASRLLSFFVSLCSWSFPVMLLAT